MRKRRRTLFLIAAGVLAVYVSSYLWLSRQGYTEADRYNMRGFYYFLPENTDTWRLKNYGCVYFFRPLNVLDRWLGLGRHPASEPLWGLSRPQ